MVFKKGQTAWNKGLTKENNPDKITYGLKGDLNSSRKQGVGRKISETRIKRGVAKGDKNPAKRPENKIKIKIGVLKAYEEGKLNQEKENNGNWLGGISKLPYSFEFNERLKIKIKERDDYECQYCHIKDKLCIHHIDYNKKNFNEDNLITLCFKDNSIANGNREYWRKFYENLIKERMTKPTGEVHPKSTYSLGVDIARIF